MNLTPWFQQEKPSAWALKPLLGTAWLLSWLSVLFLLWLVWPADQELENE